MVNGVLNIDKPKGLTSHDVVARIRKIVRGLPTEAPAVGGAKVGHTGTLDPFATGVLLVLLGKATRLAEYTRELPKTYVATLALGATSDTDDVTGNIAPYASHQPQAADIERTLQQFVGTLTQLPPAYAAVKVKGRKLYEYARAGQSVARKPRQVTVYRLALRTYSYPALTIEIECGSGTYIRALGRDIGEQLGTGAYVAELRRTAIGQFVEPGSRNSIASEGDAGRHAAAGRIEFSLPGNRKAIKLEELNPDNLPAHLHPMADLVAHLPAVIVEDANVAKLQQGESIVIGSPPLAQPCSEAAASTTGVSRNAIALFTPTHELFGIGFFDPAESLLRPKKILQS